jgi:hypothetical protein
MEIERENSADDLKSGSVCQNKYLTSIKFIARRIYLVGVGASKGRVPRN